MKCLCKNDVYFRGKLLYHKDSIFDYKNESVDFIWVEYDKNGDWGQQGLRFIVDDKYRDEYMSGNLMVFKEKFIPIDRKLKLLKIEKKIKNGEI